MATVDYVTMTQQWWRWITAAVTTLAASCSARLRPSHRRPLRQSSPQPTAGPRYPVLSLNTGRLHCWTWLTS